MYFIISSRKVYQEVSSTSDNILQKENIIVHQQPVHADSPPKNIPADLEEAITALKVAKPQRSTMSTLYKQDTSKHFSNISSEKDNSRKIVFNTYNITLIMFLF